MTTGGDPGGPAARAQVAWVNVGDSAKVLNDLADVVAVEPHGVGEPGADLENLGAAAGDRNTHPKPNSVSIRSPLGTR